MQASVFLASRPPPAVQEELIERWSMDIGKAAEQRESRPAGQGHGMLRPSEIAAGVQCPRLCKERRLCQECGSTSDLARVT
ncbi:hypothetical protein DUNSADRAFT_14536 [Dunaliella salina]|uniref:Encoded protein n=1 Tax=Dunaliella salina TaxID=3046 RepID=A0ABQ7G7B4_DUNSA|nr:hypothetical protein DUNSADRAFT_14536 [Dunaliella salina]|eukprot:KAF5830479.1 hypothetical protein DUNSADRAFT_14536 [Dunaliella salina]